MCFDISLLLTSWPSMRFKEFSISLSLGGVIRTSTRMILGVPISLLRTVAEILRQTHPKPPPEISFDPLIHSNSRDAGILLKELKKSMEEGSGRKAQGCLAGLEESSMPSTTTTQNQEDASRLSASVMQLDSDKHETQLATTQRTEFTESQNDTPSSAIRQMLTVSVMLLAGSDRPRGLLSRFLGSDKSPAQKGSTDRVSDETPRGSRGSPPPGKGKGTVSVQNGLEYRDSLHEVHLCACIFCLKERELKWQLFLLRERQEAMFSNPSVRENCAQSQLLLPELQGTQYCSGSALQRIGDNLDNDFCQRQYYTSTSPIALGLSHLQAASRVQSQLQKDPQNPSIHRFMAFITFQFIIFLHYLYPWAKAFAGGAIAIERRHRLRERLVNQTCVLLHWVWRVLIVGALGWILADPDTGRSGYRHNQRMPEKEGARGDRDEGTVSVKRWIRKCVVEVIGGVCEGVEGGVKLWCEAAEQ